jgi:hypothetical protein
VGLAEPVAVVVTAFKPWQDPATTIHPDAACNVQIYEVGGTDPWQRGIGDVPFWIGETARMPIARIGEHFAGKYWARDITYVKVYPQVYFTKGAAYAAEERLTHERLPIHSQEYNQDNPWLVKDKRGVHQQLPAVPASWNSRSRRTPPVPVPPVSQPAPAQAKGNTRRVRDALEQASRRPTTRRPVPAARTPAVRLSRRARRRLAVAGLWLAFAAAICVFVAYGSAATVGDSWWVAVGGATAIVGVLLPKRRRRR